MSGRPLVAVAWLGWAIASETPCEDAGTRIVRQKHGGSPVGVATVDVSADGRFVAFVSLARLTPADDNAVGDIYVLERATGRVTLESATAAGRAANGSSDHPRLSADGRVVVFISIATNLVGTPVDTIGTQVLRRDRATGTTTLVSRTPAGAPGHGWNSHPDVSDDGRYVVFESSATDLVAGDDTNGTGSDIYLFDAADGAVRRVSLDADGRQPPAGESMTPAISGNGRFVTFASSAPLTEARQGARSPARRDVFVRDLSGGTTRLLSATRGGGPPNGESHHPTIDGDGRRVAFVSSATDLDDDARAGRHEHVFLHDGGARLRLISRGASGSLADGNSRHPALSGDGRYVLFSSDASNLQCAGCGRAADVNLVSDVFRADTGSGRVERISGGAPGRAWWSASAGVATDRSGHVVAFSSREPVDDADLDHDDDLFVEALPEPCAPAGPP